MDRSTKLVVIKLVHTAVWLVMAVATGVVVQRSLTDDFDVMFWIAAGLLCAETLVFVVGGGRCPLSGIAARYTDPGDERPDLYLPPWLARNNVRVFVVLFVLTLVANLVLRLP